MATQRNDNGTKKAAGYFKEKFTIGLSRVTGDEVTRAIMKTTSHMLKAPNEKHLQRLLSATHGHFSEAAQKDGINMCRYIVEELEKRAHTHNWIVVLKTMLTFHAFLVDGSDEVNKVMQRNRNLFCARSIKDLADSPDGAAQGRFITAYLRYLEERNITQMRIDLEVRIESSEYLSALKMMPMNILAQALGQLLQQLECIAVVEFREHIINNFATLEAHTRLINDGSHLYAFISDRMVYALEHFDELETKAQKEEWVKVYKRYTACVQHLGLLFESMRRSRVAWGSVKIPQIKDFPEALLVKLEEALSSNNAVGAVSGSAAEVVPETEDLDAVLAQEEAERQRQQEELQRQKQQEEEASLPATMSSRITPTNGSPQVNLFGDDQFAGQQQQQQEPVAPPPVKPKLPDLDDLFAGVPQNNNANANAMNTNQWGQQQQQQQRPAQDPLDIFAAPAPTQPAWSANNGAGSPQYGYGSSSSGSAATPFGGAANNNITTNNSANGLNTTNDLFADPPTTASSPQQANGGGGIPFHQQTTTANMFGSADFAPIASQNTVVNESRFDPFSQPPRENVFVNTNQNNNMFGVNTTQQNNNRPRNDMDDLFGN